MANLTKENIADQLRKRVNALHDEATSNRLTFQVGKTSLAAVVLGGIGCAAFPALGIPAAVISAGVWLTSVFAESSTTGRIAPFPFAGVSLHQMAAGIDRMAADAGVSHDELELTDYLPAESRIEYLLILFQGDRLARLLTQVDESEIESSFAMITQMAINTYGKNGLRLSEALQEAAEFLHDAAVQCGLESAAPAAPAMAPGAQQLNPIDGAQYPVLPQHEAAPPAYQPSPNTQIGSIDVPHQTVLNSPADSTPAPTPTAAPRRHITDVPINLRAQIIKDRLESEGFKIGEMLSKSVTVIASEQRGGKGTLLGMIGILMKAFVPETQVLYFTAGSDVYPAGFDKVICAKSFPNDPNPNKRVFDELYRTVMALEKYEQYEAKNIFIVIDEAIALGDAADSAKNQKMAKYMLKQFAKSGAGAAVVLHASNLSSWLGVGNTGGMAQSFKMGVNFIGCVTQSIPNPDNPMRKIQIASGEYFLADPDNFGKRSGKDAELGKVPDFLLTQKNPYNGAPDPVRSLLAHFPELYNPNPITVIDSAPSTAQSAAKSKPAPRSAEDLDDYWSTAADEAPETGADEWQSKQETVADRLDRAIDRKLAELDQAFQNLPSGEALRVSAIRDYFRFDDAAAVQFATLYAFKNKTIVTYDPNLQALVKR